MPYLLYCSQFEYIYHATVVTDRRAKWKGVDGQFCPCSHPPPERPSLMCLTLWPCAVG